MVQCQLAQQNMIDDGAVMRACGMRLTVNSIRMLQRKRAQVSECLRWTLSCIHVLINARCMPWRYSLLENPQAQAAGQGCTHFTAAR